MGGPVLSEGDMFGKNAFSDITFYWPKDQESALGNMNFQNLIFVKRSNIHAYMQPQKGGIKVLVFFVQGCSGSYHLHDKVWT